MLAYKYNATAYLTLVANIEAYKKHIKIMTLLYIDCHGKVYCLWKDTTFIPVQHTKGQLILLRALKHQTKPPKGKLYSNTCTHSIPEHTHTDGILPCCITRETCLKNITLHACAYLSICYNNMAKANIF